ncbi:choline-sulfatase [Vallitalea longa]|uniref:Choline-sulfatase n=1 Tax=Vallitalea longa TaxID=2936439 RepID=A0A9W5YFP4_9FIRM|nr:sulfatase-like hydrolase/transferase [Vallitalea longa]GKX31463.1 choline-sulfatase [Vallitalea longa]
MEKKMNILLVFSDQLRADTIEALGNPVIKTPILNKLVESGVSFTRAYTPCPVCIPARFSMHTGFMPHKTGVIENHRMPNGYRSFMEILSEQGYQTFGTGKMHFTFDTGRCTKWGFDKRKVCDEENDFEKNDFYQNNKKNGFGHVYDYKGVKGEMYYIPQVSQLTEELHHSAWTVDESINYLKERDKDKPFFMMTSFEKPHPPFAPPSPWNKLYRGPDMPLPKRPDNSEGLKTLWNDFQNRYKYRDQGIDDNLVKMIKAYYYAEVSFIDYNLGRLLDYMEKENLMENTMIVFTADHGEFLGDYNCFGKRSFLDSSAKIPMLVKYPGCNGNIICNQLVSLIDIMPTFLQAAEIPFEEDYPGESLFDILDNKCDRDTIYGQYQKEGYANYMALSGDYKYIYSAPDNREFLFDLKMDPEETRNKANSPLYHKKTKEMREKLISYFKKEGYLDPIKDDQWKVYPKREMPDDSDAYLLFQDLPGSVPHIKGYETDSNSKKYYNFHWYK